MTYGLSRDDAGRFMSDYVRKGVFPEDPFHVLDIEGVGELLKLGAERGRGANPDLTVSICGEHGGNPESISFCREAGFDYVSCSPFRVPVARLAAAQFAIAEKIGREDEETVKPQAVAENRRPLPGPLMRSRSARFPGGTGLFATAGLFGRLRWPGEGLRGRCVVRFL